METLNFVVMGAGAWGTAMAIHLSKMNVKTVLVPRSEEKAANMREKRENSYYLPNVSFPDNLIVDVAFESYVDENTVVFLACPTQGLVQVCQLLKPLQSQLKCVISLVKGLNRSSLKTPSEMIASILPDVPVACLSGPTYAREFSLGKPAAMVLAGDFEGILSLLQQRLSTDSVRVYRSRDLRGVELGSCLKNIYAVGAGILDGLELGDNARSAYLTRALKEMAYLGVHLGGQKETFYGLSGLGDLIATAQGSWSRNRSFGHDFARGETIDALLKDKTVEGYWSIECFEKLVKIYRLDAPILESLYRVFYENYALSLAVKSLMTRELKEE